MENTKTNNMVTVKKIAFPAMAIALGTLASMVTVFKMPMGGSVTPFSMLFITLIGSWFGVYTGVACGIGYGLLQFILGPYVLSIPQVICDYFLAFGALGLSGLFKDQKHGVMTGYVAGVLGRYFFAVVSGVVFFASYAAEAGFDSALLYSMAYNGLYLGAEAAMTLAILMLPPVRQALAAIKNQIQG